MAELTLGAGETVVFLSDLEGGAPFWGLDPGEGPPSAAELSSPAWKARRRLAELMTFRDGRIEALGAGVRLVYVGNAWPPAETPAAPAAGAAPSGCAPPSGADTAGWLLALEGKHEGRVVLLRGGHDLAAARASDATAMRYCTAAHARARVHVGDATVLAVNLSAFEGGVSLADDTHAALGYSVSAQITPLPCFFFRDDETRCVSLRAHGGRGGSFRLLIVTAAAMQLVTRACFPGGGCGVTLDEAARDMLAGRQLFSMETMSERLPEWDALLPARVLTFRAAARSDACYDLVATADDEGSVTLSAVAVEVATASRRSSEHGSSQVGGRATAVAARRKGRGLPKPREPARPPKPAAVPRPRRRAARRVSEARPGWERLPLAWGAAPY
jgi:hypothetical protein